MGLLPRAEGLAVAVDRADATVSSAVYNEIAILCVLLIAGLFGMFITSYFYSANSN